MSYLVNSPFGALNQLNRELNRMLTDQPPYSASVDTNRWMPQVDIYETDEAFQVAVDTPGVNPADIELSLHQGVLTIRGERTTAPEGSGNNFARRERASGSFFRQFSLPDSADEETVTAKANNGVLEIIIPKAKPAKPINIKIAGE